MANKKPEEPPKGSPAWMATFSDLMNLLLCFFVLLFSMSTVDAEKFELVIASLQSSFSVLPSGGSSIGEGQLISSGISQLENFDVFFNASTDGDGNVEEPNESEEQGGGEHQQTTATAQEAQEAVEAEALAESEEMAEEMEEQAEEQNIADQIEIDFNSQYVQLTLNGALLFDSGQSDIREDAYPLVDRIGTILSNYESNIIEIEGHTDNVPIHTDRYESNNVLSAFRALDVMEYLLATTDLDPTKLKSSGRGEYVPIADNSTAEGRALNRRVEIKIYNTFNSQN